MKDVAPCPHCGASMIARNSAGDIVCAYCDAVIAYHETPALEPRYAPRYGLPPSLYGSCYGAGTMICSSEVVGRL